MILCVAKVELKIRLKAAYYIRASLPDAEGRPGIKGFVRGEHG